MSDDERRVSLPTSRSVDADRRERADDRQRSRSRSPVGEKKRKRKDAGFKWKEKRRDDDAQPREEGVKRGYRDHYKPKERSRSRSRERRRERSRSPRRRDYDRRDRDWDRDRDYGRDREEGNRTRERHSRDERPGRNDRPEGRDERKEKKEKKPASAVPSMPQQEMILVTVNDRLGTKKQIPCLPTDTIKDFKSVVAMMIGRRPHEILLKRQSERPFKDFLTLQDYGISNNVQLDLEVDTGD